MDADAKQVMDMLVAMAPLPTMDTHAAEYRDKQAQALAARPKDDIPIERVETFEIEAIGGPVRVRLYADGEGSELRPTLIYMHGGGFVTCSIESHDHYCRRLAQETGLAVLSIDYRLAPEHPFPAGFEDCRDVLVWAASEAATAKGIDNCRLAVGGDSAGGAFAAALCHWAKDNEGPVISHQLLIYPVLANDFSTPSYADNAHDYFLTTEAMQWFWRQYLGDENAQTDELASPGKRGDLSRLPATTILTATFDPLRDEAAVYASRLQAAGVPVSYRDYPAFHGFAGLEMLSSANASRAFIVERLKAAMLTG